MGNVLVEAMPCSAPVVGSLISAVGEVDEDGKTGFLARSLDVQEFADAMQIFADDHTRGRGCICHRFSLDEAVNKTLAPYESVWRT